MGARHERLVAGWDDSGLGFWVVIILIIIFFQGINNTVLAIFIGLLIVIRYTIIRKWISKRKSKKFVRERIP